MQQIERYGVIALVFMAVTVVAVYLWDDGGANAPDAGAAAASARGRDAAGTSRAEGRSLAPLSTSERAPSGFDAPAGESPARPTRGAGFVDRPRGDSQVRAERAGREAAGGAGEVERDALGFREEPTARRRELEEQRERAAVELAGFAGEQAPARETARSAPAGRRYRIGSGDTLERIAARELGSGARWTEIQALNAGLDPLKLFVGKEIVLPGGAAGGAPTQTAVTTAAARPASTSGSANGGTSGRRTYSVQKGDMLGTIAQSQLGSAKRWQEIVDLNPGVDPKKLHVGMVLVLPGAAAAAGEEGRALPPSPSSREGRVAEGDRGSRFVVR